MEKHYSFLEYKGYNVIEIKNSKFDLFEIPEMSKKIESRLIELGYPSLIIDIDKIKHIDSTGFGFLMSTRNTIDRHGNELVVVCSLESILHVIEMLNMNRFLKVFKTLDDAVEYLSGK